MQGIRFLLSLGWVVLQNAGLHRLLVSPYKAPISPAGQPLKEP
jgi:hypothetical protein